MERFSASFLAGTRRKNLAFSDTRYIDNLIGRETVNTRGR